MEYGTQRGILKKNYINKRRRTAVILQWGAVRHDTAWVIAFIKW